MRWLAVRDKPAVGQHQNTVGEPRGETKMMGHDNDQGALPGGGMQQLHCLKLMARVE